MPESKNNTISLSTSLPVVFGFLILLLLPFNILLVPFDLGEFRQDQLGDLIKNIVIIIYGYAMIRKFGYERLAGLGFRPLKNTYLVLVPLYFVVIGFVLYNVIDFQLQNIGVLDAAILFMAMLSVGFSEEIIFRGFVQSDLLQGVGQDPKELLKRLLVASLMFGVLHLFNLFKDDVYVPAIISQVIYATMFGVAFGIILLRTGSLWPLGIIHGVINFTFSLEDVPGAVRPEEMDIYEFHDAVLSVLIVIPLFLMALKELKKVNLSNHSENM